MRVYTQQQQDHLYIDITEYGRLRITGRVSLVPASMQHVHGPHWHDIVWVRMHNRVQQDRPHICGNHSNDQLRNMLAKDLV